MAHLLPETVVSCFSVDWYRVQWHQVPTVPSSHHSQNPYSGQYVSLSVTAGLQLAQLRPTYTVVGLSPVTFTTNTTVAYLL